MSVTSIVAKVFESIIYDEIYKHIERNSVISTNQHGFQREKSTTTNLLDFWDRVTKIADNSKPLSIIYTDLRKAFDTVPHDLLLHKLEHYGVREQNQRWIRNFLDSRKQRVVSNGDSSPFINVESGVPQGGTLSGLFFILYMNDLPKKIKHSQVSLYADDAKIFAPVTCSQDIDLIQQDLDALLEWCIEWRLSLNAKKCVYIHYTPMHKTDLQPQYTIQNVQLQRKDSVVDLGVIISEDLKFHKHIDHICKKARRETGRIKRSFKSRNYAFLSDVYKTYVRPHLEYAVPVWNPVHKLDITKIEKAQNNFTKLLKHGSVMTPQQRNEALGLTTHEQRRYRGDLIQMYKFSEKGMFKHKPETRTRTNSKAIEIQRPRISVRAHSFYCRNTLKWNNLPESTLSASSTNQFKTEIDKYLSDR